MRLRRLIEDSGVSQTPIREALARLEGQRLVERRPMAWCALASVSAMIWQLTGEGLDWLAYGTLTVYGILVVGYLRRLWVRLMYKDRGYQYD